MINAVIDTAREFISNEESLHRLEVLLELLATCFLVYEAVHFAAPLPDMANGGLSTIPGFEPVLANERTQIRSDPVPGLSVDTLGAFRVEIAVTRSESDLDRSG